MTNDRTEGRAEPPLGAFADDGLLKGRIDPAQLERDRRLVTHVRMVVRCSLGLLLIGAVGASGMRTIRHFRHRASCAAQEALLKDALEQARADLKEHRAAHGTFVGARLTADDDDKPFAVRIVETSANGYTVVAFGRAGGGVPGDMWGLSASDAQPRHLTPETCP